MDKMIEQDGKMYKFVEDINATCDDCDLDSTDHFCPKCDGGVYKLNKTEPLINEIRGFDSW